jgi:phosphoribosylformimino-5-aminoimidazole carboxamide ribotide isomerase
MNFEVIPAVDIKEGRCVQLVQGRADREIISLKDPVKVAKRWIDDGAKRLHIIDLDGAFQERRNIDMIKEINEYGTPIEVGGGIRSYDDAVTFLNMGIDRIILGTAAVKEKNLVYRLSNEFQKDRIMLALDVKEGEVMIEGWKEKTHLSPVELGIELEDSIGSILFTNIDVEGLSHGIEINPIEDIVRSMRIPIIVAGGVSSIEDVMNIRATGAKGVVIGTAIYNGKIRLKDAMKYAND